MPLPDFLQQALGVLGLIHKELIDALDRLDAEAVSFFGEVRWSSLGPSPTDWLRRLRSQDHWASEILNGSFSLATLIFPASIS